MLPFTASYKKYTLIFKKPAGTSRGFLRSKDVYYLHLTDRNKPGWIGIGECAPWQGLSIDDRPDFESKLANVCQRINQGYPPEALNLADFPALAFGLETALLDWRGGATGHLFDTSFSRGEAGIPIHGLIWMGSRTEMIRQVHHKVSQRHRCIKMKIGALDFEEERQLLADIRAHYPPEQIELRLDANGAFSPENALNRLTMLAQFNIHSVEQPIKPAQWPAMADLCARSPISIALDEELIGLKTKAKKEALLEKLKPEYIVLKPALIGGFAAAEEWIALAEGQGIGWWVNSALESSIGLNALCQWTASLKPAIIQGLGSGQLYENNLPTLVKVANGSLICEKR